MTQSESINTFTQPETLSESDIEKLILMLRRKEETWVDWGKACQALQKSGQSPQNIFEATGFEPIQQNQIIVSTQIYGNLQKLEAPSEVLEYFAQRRSDILYEFRILGQSDRVKAATLAMAQNIDADEAHLIAKSIRDFSRLRKQPKGFSDAPGDAVAYESWRLARQKDDLQERSRLIARGLQYAESKEARKQLEKLLTDFSVIQAKNAPRLPLYRLEQNEELPRVIPVLGEWPLQTKELASIPVLDEKGAFRIVRHEGAAAWFAVPGWQVIRQAEDPIAFLAKSNELDISIPEPIEPVMIMIDRAQREWNDESYFVTDDQGQLTIQWFTEAPSDKLLGKIILIMRPQKVASEELQNDDLWHIDE
ncbi:MAG: hypothetical protein HC810_00050 [Acaryochloridaceae cyanobacterium RL_2_7]|nr:hypothetical protein [Acaryochloridaceae cyanobacterium RL_2_7]